MKRIQILVIMLAMALTSAFAQTPTEWSKLKKDVNFYVANDLGRNGYYDQKPIAELMGRMAETVSSVWWLPETSIILKAYAVRRIRCG